MNFIRIFSVAILLLSTAACNHGTYGIPDDFDYGKAEDGVYSNPYFSFKMQYPEDWHLLSREEAEELKARAMENRQGNKFKKEMTRHAIENNTAQLLMLFRYSKEEGIRRGANPSLMIMAENTSSLGLVNTGLDYLDIVKHKLENKNMRIADKEASGKVQLAEMEFHYLTIESKDNQSPYKQRYYATVRRDFSVVIIISWTNSAEEEKLMEIVNTMEEI